MVRAEMIERAKKEILAEMTKNTCKRCMIRVEEGQKFCPRCQKMDDMQMEFTRNKTKREFNVQINNIQRDIDFKKNQLENGITETRIIKISDTGEATMMDGFKDGMKPKHIILNEIDHAKARKAMIEDQIAALKIAEEEDARETTEPGDKGTGA